MYYDPILPQDVIEPYGTASSTEDAKERLFLVLYHHKTAVTYDVLGLSFGMSNGVAFNYVQLGKRILKAVLIQKTVYLNDYLLTEQSLTLIFETQMSYASMPLSAPLNVVLMN